MTLVLAILQLDIENSYRRFIAFLDNACNRFILKIAPKKNVSPAWFTTKKRHSLNKTHTVRHQIKRKQTESQLVNCKLKTLENKRRLVIELSKEKFIVGLVDAFQSEPKKLYR